MLGTVDSLYLHVPSSDPIQNSRQDSDYAEILSVPPCPEPRPDGDYTEAYSHIPRNQNSSLNIQINSRSIHESRSMEHCYSEIHDANLSAETSANKQMENDYYDDGSTWDSTAEEEIETQIVGTYQNCNGVNIENMNVGKEIVSPDNDYDERDTREKEELKDYEWKAIPSKDYAHPESEPDTGKINDDNMDNMDEGTSEWRHIPSKDYIDVQTEVAYDGNETHDDEVREGYEWRSMPSKDYDNAVSQAEIPHAEAKEQDVQDPLDLSEAKRDVTQVGVGNHDGDDDISHEGQDITDNVMVYEKTKYGPPVTDTPYAKLTVSRIQ